MPPASTPPTISIVDLDVYNTDFLRSQPFIWRSQLFGHRFATAYVMVSDFATRKKKETNYEERIKTYCDLLYGEMLLYEGSAPTKPVHTIAGYAKFRAGLVISMSGHNVAEDLRNHFIISPRRIVTGEPAFTEMVPLGKIRWWLLTRFNWQLTIDSIQAAADRRRLWAQWLSAEEQDNQLLAEMVDKFTKPGSRTGARSLSERSALNPKTPVSERSDSAEWEEDREDDSETDSRPSLEGSPSTNAPRASVPHASQPESLFENEEAHLRSVFSSVRLNSSPGLGEKAKRGKRISHLIDNLVEMVHDRLESAFQREWVNAEVCSGEDLWQSASLSGLSAHSEIVALEQRLAAVKAETRRVVLSFTESRDPQSNLSTSSGSLSGRDDVNPKTATETAKSLPRSSSPPPSMANRAETANLSFPLTLLQTARPPATRRSSSELNETQHALANPLEVLAVRDPSADRSGPPLQLSPDLAAQAAEEPGGRRCVEEFPNSALVESAPPGTFSEPQSVTLANVRRSPSSTPALHMRPIPECADPHRQSPTPTDASNSFNPISDGNIRASSYGDVAYDGEKLRPLQAIKTADAEVKPTVSTGDDTSVAGQGFVPPEDPGETSMDQLLDGWSRYLQSTSQDHPLDPLSMNFVVPTSSSSAHAWPRSPELYPGRAQDTLGAAEASATSLHDWRLAPDLTMADLHPFELPFAHGTIPSSTPEMPAGHEPVAAGIVRESGPSGDHAALEATGGGPPPDASAGTGSWRTLDITQSEWTPDDGHQIAHLTSTATNRAFQQPAAIVETTQSEYPHAFQSWPNVSTQEHGRCSLEEDAMSPLTVASDEAAIESDSDAPRRAGVEPEDARRGEGTALEKTPPLTSAEMPTSAPSLPSHLPKVSTNPSADRRQADRKRFSSSDEVHAERDGRALSPIVEEPISADAPRTKRARQESTCAPFAASVLRSGTDSEPGLEPTPPATEKGKAQPPLSGPLTALPGTGQEPRASSRKPSAKAPPSKRSATRSRGRHEQVPSQSNPSQSARHAPARLTREVIRTRKVSNTGQSRILGGGENVCIEYR
ncbi:unnamed protein product [Peniophora sp. CBMAI 1063]|nr:unnamed protein product [Peniophora sp. CBMAI 1063]